MKLEAALEVIRREGRGVAICKGGRSEYHIQYTIDQQGRVCWEAGGTVGGLAVGGHAPDLESEGWQVFPDRYSRTPLL